MSFHHPPRVISLSFKSSAAQPNNNMVEKEVEKSSLAIPAMIMPPPEPYEALKTCLCKVYCSSKAEIAARILDAPQLRDSTVSDLAARMLPHLPLKQQDHILVRECFLHRLPLDILRVVETNPNQRCLGPGRASGRAPEGQGPTGARRDPRSCGCHRDLPKAVARRGGRPPQDSGKRKGPKTWCRIHRKYRKEARNCISDRCEWPNYPVATLSEIQENWSAGQGTTRQTQDN